VKPRKALEALRKSIRAAAPQSTETISYRIPMFKLGSPLVAMAAFENHCGFYVMSPAVMKAHANDLTAYPTATATIRFPPGKPLPKALVTKLVLARVAEIEARAAAKKQPRKG
jgi:uncharacterized protein YdhG (YjbR/CyaY superfamily)